MIFFRRPTVTVDANVLIPSFSRYLFLRLCESMICNVVYSDLIRAEFARNLLEIVPNMDDDKIAKICKDMVDTGALEYALDKDEHANNIDMLIHTTQTDRHVLYLAYLSKSRFLVTNNLKDFLRETVEHKDHKQLEFYSKVIVVSFDDFFCMLLCKRRLAKKVRIDVARTMAHIPDKSVEDILGKLHKDNLCRKACDLLMPHFEEIENLVEKERQSLSQSGGFS